MLITEDRDFSHVARDIEQCGVAVIPKFLTPQTLASLHEEAERLEWQRAPATHGSRNVAQDYEFVDSFADGPTFLEVNDAMEGALNVIFSHTASCPISIPMYFTEMRLQRYAAGSIGIAEHREGLKCVDLVVLVILQAGGRFTVRLDDASAPKLIRNSVGDAVLMRASGYGGMDIQPLHALIDVHQPRMTLALRRMRMGR